MLLVFVGIIVAFALAYYIVPMQWPDFLPLDQRLAFACLMVAVFSLPAGAAGAFFPKTLECTSKAQGFAIIVSNPLMACKK